MVSGQRFALVFSYDAVSGQWPRSNSYQFLQESKSFYFGLKLSTRVTLYQIQRTAILFDCVSLKPNVS